MRMSAATAAAPSLSAARTRARSRQPHVRNQQAGQAIVRQRRGYARRVLQGLARVNRGCPTKDVERQLVAALGPLGVRLTAVQRHELSTAIHAGRPVDLP